jgi:outer membrane murein-binding lipoprotein Lpp
VILIGAVTRAFAVGAVLAASVLLSGCVSTVSGTAVRAQNAAPVDVPPLTEAKLDDVLLSIGELNGIMGSTQMKVTSELEEMTDHSGEVSDPDCLGAIYGAEEPVYAGSGWTAMRDQVAREPGEDNEHWVEQTAVLYPSADNAQKFFDDSKAAWEDCSGFSVSVDDLDASYLWQIDSVTAEDALITQMTAQEDADGWACQHALSVVSNLTVEAWACSYNPKDEAATIANDMIANAAKK